MKTIGRVTGWALIGAGYLYCFVMLWMNVIDWWGTGAIWAFILSPVFALFIPLISWIIEGAFPVLLLAGWGAIILGCIIVGVTNRE